MQFILRWIQRFLSFWPLSLAPQFASTEALIQAIRDLVKELEAHGFTGEARILTEGLASLNGLTDGWALLMEALGKVAFNQSGRLIKSDAAKAKRLYREVRKVVYRR